MDIIKSQNSIIDFLNLLNKSSKEIKGISLLSIILLIYICNNLLDISINTIFALSISCIFIYYILYKEEYEINTNLNQETEYKLNILNSILTKRVLIQLNGKNINKRLITDSYLYLDPNIINLLYNVLEYNEYAPDIYFKILKYTNKLLQIKYEIPFVLAETCIGDYYNGKKIMKNSINFFHSMIYNIPRNKLVINKFNKLLKRFHILLKRILDYIKDICEKKNKEAGMTIYTRFIQNHDGPEDYLMYDDNDQDFQFF